MRNAKCEMKTPDLETGNLWLFLTFRIPHSSFSIYPKVVPGE